jgi:lipase maturation factor 1
MGGWRVISTSANEPTFAWAAWLFLRLLGIIYLVAFISLAVQIRGLVGTQGILPAPEFLQTNKKWGWRRFYRLPTLCWFGASDRSLLLLAWGGAGVSLLLILGVAPAICLAVLWLAYLSLFKICRIFLGYQWDILLLEAGLLAIFLAPPLEIAPQFPSAFQPSPIMRWLFWWLLFRLMFSSGMVKLRSGDLAWRRLTALCHHYETQPLPTPLAWYAYQLPPRVHKMSALVMFAIELLVPFLILGPAPLRHVAAGLFILLMVLIQLTGNYGFFNLLGIALSLLLLDDAFLLKLFSHDGLSSAAPAINPWPNWVLLIIAALILSLSIIPVLRLFHLELNWPRPIRRLLEFLNSFHLVNSYGLFAVMTTERPELIVEGSPDGVTWRAYEFKWKPGELKRPPRFVAPHQPRLDWQMWFAALGFFPNNPWFERFLLRLLEGSPAVLSLLANNPFPNRPPRFIRAVLYDYRFTDSAQRAATGAWWRRERRGLYSPEIETHSKPS